MSEAQETAVSTRFRLAIVAGKGKGREFLFDQSSVTIGRMPTCDLVLYDSNVSRSHCQITYEGDAVVLRDIGSANGTFLNETLTTEAHVVDGDRIGVGPVTFEFRMDVGESLDELGPQFVLDPESDSERRRIEGASTRALDFRGVRALFAARQDAAAPAKLGGDRSGSRSSSRSDAHKARRGRFRLATTLALFAAVVSVGAAGVLVYRTLSERTRVDRSKEVFAVNEGNAELRFGAGKVDVYTPRVVTFAFDYEGGKATVEFATGGIDTDDEVSIELNGKTIGHAPASPARWTAGHAIDLPRELLYNGRNLIAFRHHPLAGAVPRWGIARVVVKEAELPKVNVARAEQLFELGKAAFETRTVARPSLARAIEYLEEARLFLEGVEERPPLYYDIGKNLAKARRELQETFDSHIFAAEQAIRFGERQRAIESLQELLQYIPDENDARHSEARARLEALRGAD